MIESALFDLNRDLVIFLYKESDKYTFSFFSTIKNLKSFDMEDIHFWNNESSIFHLHFLKQWEIFLNAMLMWLYAVFLSETIWWWNKMFFLLLSLFIAIWNARISNLKTMFYYFSLISFQIQFVPTIICEECFRDADATASTLENLVIRNDKMIRDDKKW